jgi:hypothetical protein
MRRCWVRSGTWSAVLLLATGCWTTAWSAKRDARPPRQPEEYIVPPETASRFSSPPDYPREAQKDKLAKPKLDEPGVPGPGPGPGASRFGAGPGMRP